jgi:hypothetical protein
MLKKKFIRFTLSHEILDLRFMFILFLDSNKKLIESGIKSRITSFMTILWFIVSNNNFTIEHKGETSFGLEPNIENTITNVAIETSFANDFLKSSSGENDQKETAAAEKSSHSYMDDLKELSTSMQSAQTAKETEDEETATTTANSTATTTTAASTMSFINRHLSTVSTPSSSSAGGEEESSTSSPSPSSSSTSKGANTSSSSFSVGSDDVVKKDEEEAVESSSNIKSECEMKTQDEDETTSKTTSDANNYSMQINYPSSTVSEELSSNDRTSSSTSHSSSFNKCESDENEIRCDLSDIPTKVSLFLINI